MTGGGTVDEPIGRHRSDRLRMAIRSDGRPATHPLSGARALPRAHLPQSEARYRRTHQIRVHLAHLKHPLVGDPGLRQPSGTARGAGEALIAALRGFRRQALHAAALAFDHPVRAAQRLAFEAPAPRRFRRPARRRCAPTRPATPAIAASVRGLSVARVAHPRMAGTARGSGALHAARGRREHGPLRVAQSGRARRRPAPRRSRRTAGACVPPPGCPPSPHGCRSSTARVSSISTWRTMQRRVADASFTRRPGRVCAILTADCLPVLLASDSGGAVAAAHAGWRGLAAGVIEATVAGPRRAAPLAPRLDRSGHRPCPLRDRARGPRGSC